MVLSCGRNGRTVGMWSWNCVSQASTATTGALATLALFASCTCCANRPRAPSSRTYSTLSGCVFAVVGPHLARSQIAASSASLTGFGANVFAVRASVNKTARPWLSKGLSDGAARLTMSVTPCLLSDGIRADRSLGPGGRLAAAGREAPLDTGSSSGDDQVP